MRRMNFDVRRPLKGGAPAGRRSHQIGPRRFCLIALLASGFKSLPRESLESFDRARLLSREEGFSLARGGVSWCPAKLLRLCHGVYLGFEASRPHSLLLSQHRACFLPSLHRVVAKQASACNQFGR